MILFCFDQSSPLVKLTKATDKIVKFVKHIFYRHIVSHYNITNTVSRKLLVNVVVTACALDAIGFDEVLTKPLKSLPYDTPGVTYVAFKNPKGASLSKCKTIDLLTIYRNCRLTITYNKHPPNMISTTTCQAPPIRSHHGEYSEAD
ncbi:coatomer subunit gamma [Trifolium repens]|nr:coatomer subunit gamma [Trifolium repens]